MYMAFEDSSHARNKRSSIYWIDSVLGEKSTLLLSIQKTISALPMLCININNHHHK